MPRVCPEPGPARRAIWRALNAARAAAGMPPMDQATLARTPIADVHLQLRRLRDDQEERHGTENGGLFGEARGGRMEVHLE